MFHLTFVDTGYVNDDETILSFSRVKITFKRPIPSKDITLDSNQPWRWSRYCKRAPSSLEALKLYILASPEKKQLTNLNENLVENKNYRFTSFRNHLKTSFSSFQNINFPDTKRWGKIILNRGESVLRNTYANWILVNKLTNYKWFLKATILRILLITSVQKLQLILPHLYTSKKGYNISFA